MTAREVGFLKACNSDIGVLDTENVTNTLFRECREIEESKIVAIKSWCMENNNEDGQISLFRLHEFVKKVLNLDPIQTTKTAFEHGILMSSPSPGKALVV